MWTGASVAGVQPARVGSGEGSQLAEPFLSHCSGGLGPHLPHVCEADGFGFGAASSCEPEQRATGVSALTVVAGTLAFSSSPLGRRVAERRKILSPLWPRARAGWPVGSRQAWGWRRRSSPRGRACACCSDLALRGHSQLQPLPRCPAEQGAGPPPQWACSSGRAPVAGSSRLSRDSR